MNHCISFSGSVQAAHTRSGDTGIVRSRTRSRAGSDQYSNAGCYLQVEPNRLLMFTSVMAEDFRPVAPANGATNSSR